MIVIIRGAAFLSSLCVAGLIAHPASARAPMSDGSGGALRDSSPTDQVTGVDDAPEQSVSSESSSLSDQQPGLEDIVVTATRREEALQDIPVSVTAVGGDALRTAGIDDIRSLTAVVPGYTGGRAAMVMQPNIRGVGSVGVSIGDESNVATYVDGVYLAGPYSTQVDLVEVQRVEVLRGPQGTVFGRNATGGLINVITPDPSFTPRANMSASYGRMREDANAFDIRAYATGPINDTIAADVSFMVKYNEGYYTDLVRGGTFEGTRTITWRTKFLAEPRDNIRLIFTAAYTDLNSEIPTQPYLGQTVARGDPRAIVATAPWTAALDHTPTSNLDRLDLSLKAQVDLGAVTFESVTSYAKSHVTQFADTDASNIFVAFSELQNAEQKEYSQELRLLSNSASPLSWTAGVYFFGLDGTMPFLIVNNRGTSISTTLLGPDLGTRSFAGYAQGTYEVTDGLFVTLGGRYTTEERSFRQSVNGNDLFGEVSERFNRFTYNTALRYALSPNANVYASFGTGFKSGVYNGAGTSPNPVEPETIKALEVGIKGDPFPWMRFNAAAYRYWYDDLQVNARAADNSFVLQNAAAAKIYGGEIEVTLLPVQDLRITSAIAYTNGEYSDFPAAQSFSPLPSGGNVVFAADASGQALIKTPRYTFNLGVNYEHALSRGAIRFGANVFHSARVYYDFLNLYSQDPYTLMSAELVWLPGGGLSAGLYGKNLTDEEVSQQIRPGATGTYTFFERPRELGVRLRYEF